MKVISWKETANIDSEIDEIGIPKLSTTDLISLMNRNELAFHRPTSLLFPTGKEVVLIKYDKSQLSFESNHVICVLLGKLFAEEFTQDQRLQPLFDKVWEIKNYEARTLAEGCLFYHLSKKADLDWVVLFKEPALKKYGFYKVLLQFSNLIGYRNFDPDLIVKIVSDNYAEINNNGYFYNLVSNIAAKAKTDADWATKCFERFIHLEEPVSTQLVPPLFRAISESQGNKKILTVLDAWIKSTKIPDKKIAIMCAGQLRYANEEENKWFEAFLNLLEQERYKSDELVVLKLYAATNQINTSSLCKQIVVANSSASSESIKNAVAYALDVNNKLSSEKWYEEAFLNLADLADTTSNGVLHHLNTILRHLIDENFPLFKTCFTTLISSKNFSFELAKSYNDPLKDLLRKKPDDFSTLISEWFNNEDPKFHIFIERFSSELFTSNQHKIELSKSYLDSVDERDFVFIINKVVGFIPHNKSQTYLLLSCLQRDPCPERLATVIKDVFVRHICYNYYSTIELLESIKSHYNAATQTTIDKIIEESKAYFDTRAALPVAKELAASEKRAKMYYDVRNRKMPKIKPTGFFSSFAKQIILKGGKYWFCKQEGKYTRKAQLGHFEYSGELPRGERIDPVGQHLFRIRFKLYKKGE